jgi:hypothetical protein
MPGQHIWRIKVRRTGQAEAEIAEPQLDRGRGPVHGEIIDASAKRKSVRAKIVAFSTSTSVSTVTYSIQAVEEHDGNRPRHCEADEDDF